MAKSSARPPAMPDPVGPCPCGLERSYPDCCGGLHAGQHTAATAQALMRSRYSAFAVHEQAYLLRTWHPSTRPQRVRFAAGLRWTGLVILGTTGGSALHTEGTVEFEASYLEDGQADALHENSHFLRIAGNWVYLGPAT